jgi:hypothetical protein
MTSYSALAARREATGIAGFCYSLLIAALLTINGIDGEMAIYRHLNEVRGKWDSRQFASMCMATIARTAPAVNVVAATNSIARLA